MNEWPTSTQVLLDQHPKKRGIGVYWIPKTAPSISPMQMTLALFMDQWCPIKLKPAMDWANVSEGFSPLQASSCNFRPQPRPEGQLPVLGPRLLNCTQAADLEVKGPVDSSPKAAWLGGNHWTSNNTTSPGKTWAGTTLGRILKYLSPSQAPSNKPPSDWLGVKETFITHNILYSCFVQWWTLPRSK